LTIAPNGSISLASVTGASNNSSGVNDAMNATATDK
jgi:hypothetical protein